MYEYNDPTTTYRAPPTLTSIPLNLKVFRHKPLDPVKHGHEIVCGCVRYAADGVVSLELRACSWEEKITVYQDSSFLVYTAGDSEVASLNVYNQRIVDV